MGGYFSRVLRRNSVAARADIEEKKMFGGMTFMLGGHLCCGVAGGELVLRLGKTGAFEAFEISIARYCDFTGKPMKTMVSVKLEGYQDDGALKKWVRRAVDFTSSQPAKR